MRPNSNDQGFLASYLEFVDCNFIKEPRPHGPKSHKRVFLRTLLNNFPTICSRQRIAESIAGFLSLKRRQRRLGANMYEVLILLALVNLGFTNYKPVFPGRRTSPCIW